MRISVALALALAAVSVCLSGTTVAAAKQTGQTASRAAAPMTEGLVKKVDRSTGKVTITHGALPNGMPAMTMAFPVKEAAWLKQLKAGDRIRFAIDDAMTIVRFERMQQ